MRATNFNKLLPKRVPIAFKLAFAITLLIAGGMTVLGLAVISNQTQVLRSQINEFGTTVVDQVAETSIELVLSDDLLGLRALINNTNHIEPILGAAIYSDKGEVLAAAGALPAETVPGLYDFATQLEDHHYSHDWQWHDGGASGAHEVVSFMVPVKFRNLIAGHALVTFTRSYMTRSLSNSLQTIIAATAIMVLLGIFGAIILGRRLSRPIHGLMNASAAIGSGDFSYRISERRNDELGSLIDGFNIMAEGLLEKNQVENALSRYVSSNVAERIMDNLDEVELGGRRVFASVLFADIVSFTSLSEKLPPEQVAELLNEYFSFINQACEAYHGTIDKFMGDCTMVVFGVLEPDEDHRFNSIACAVMIQRLIERMNVERSMAGKLTVNFRIGINSGEMLAGNLGSHQRMQYTVVGDSVNLASRLASIAGRGQIVITEEIYQSTDVKWRVRGHKHRFLNVRGKDEAITTYLVTDIIGSYRNSMHNRIQQALPGSTPKAQP